MPIRIHFTYSKKPIEEVLKEVKESIEIPPKKKLRTRKKVEKKVAEPKKTAKKVAKKKK